MICTGRMAGQRKANMDGHRFMFTNVSTAMRRELVTKVKHLGGTCLDSNNFDKKITHLVCGCLKKTEKFLGACISGKWIVGPQFIVDSYEVGMWLEEENYLFRVENKDPVLDNLAMAARRWRIQVNHFDIMAFSGWRVALLMAAEKAAVFKRLLRYGGAVVVKLTIPFSKCSKKDDITHVFVDSLHTEYVAELQALGCLCLKEQFLGLFILKDPSPDPFDYIPTNDSANETLLDSSVGTTLKTTETKTVKNSTDCQPSSNIYSPNNSFVDTPCSSSARISWPSNKSSKIAFHDHQALNSCSVTTNCPCDNSSYSGQSEKAKAKQTALRNNEMNRSENKRKGDNLNDQTMTAIVRVERLEHSTSKPCQVEKEGKRKLVVMNAVDKSGVKDLNKEETSTESSNATSAGKTEHTISFSNNSNNSNSSAVSNFANSSSQSIQHIQQKWRMPAQENPAIQRAKPSRTERKPQFALEYLDPNVPSVRSSSSFQNLNNLKDLKHTSDVTSINIPSSSQSLPIKAVDNAKSTSGLMLSSDQKKTSERDQLPDPSLKSTNTLGSSSSFGKKDTATTSLTASARKRVMESCQDDVESSPQKKWKSIQEYSDKHSEDRMPELGGHSLHSPQTTSEKNGVRTSRVGHDCPRLNSIDCENHEVAQYEESSNCCESSVFIAPISAEQTVGRTDNNQAIGSVEEPESISINVKDASIFKTPIKSYQRKSPSKQKSPTASLKLSPNIYLYGMCQTAASTSGERKTPVKTKLPKTPVKTKSTPDSHKSGSKTNGKSTQSVLSQFGFRSTSKDENRPSPSMEFLVPKSEPVSPSQKSTVLPKQRKRNQLVIGLGNDSGEIITISDDEDDETLKQPSVNTVLSSGEEGDKGDQMNSDVFSAQNKSGVIIVSSSSGEDVIDSDNENKIKFQDKRKVSESWSKQSYSLPTTSKWVPTPNSLPQKEIKISELDIQSKTYHVVSNKKSTNGEASGEVRNVFESLSTFITDSRKKNSDIPQNGDSCSNHSDVLDLDKVSPMTLLSAKRQLFQGNNGEGVCNDPSVNEKDASKLSTEGISSCDRKFSRSCLNDVFSNNDKSSPLCSLTPKIHSVGSKPSSIEDRMHSSEFHHSDNDKEQDVQMDRLPHIAWFSSFCSYHTASTADEEKYVPSILSQCMESSRENGFFSEALEHGKPTLARIPNVDLLSQFVHLLACDDETIKNQAFSDLMSWSKNHPPTVPSTIGVYSDLFELLTDQTLLCNLLDGLCDIKDSDVNFLLLEFVTAVFEMNFSFCLQSRDRKTMRDCLLVKWFWTHSQAIHHNRKTRKLLQVFETVLARSESTITAIHSLSTLISMVAECFRLSLVQWTTQNRSFHSDTITSFALDTAKIIRDVCFDKEPISILTHLTSFKPAWFRVMVTACVLSFYNDYLLSQRIQVSDISLHTIVSQYFFLLPPLSNRGNVNMSQRVLQTSQHQDEFSLRIRTENVDDSISCVGKKSKDWTWNTVNRKNGKGESALHTAAIKGDVITMKRLLSVPGIDVNLKDNNGWTPLHEACNHGKHACVELLLKYVPSNTVGSFFHKKEGHLGKVDINPLGDQNITPLHDAVLNNHVEICRLLMKYGGKRLLETKTARNYTAMDLASTIEMHQVLSAGMNGTSDQSVTSLNLSQDSQESFNLSQSEFLNDSDNMLPQNHMYEQVLNMDDAGDVLSASYSNCSVFVSLISLLLNSYLKASFVTVKSKDDGHPTKVSLLQSHEKGAFRKLPIYIKLFKKHLKKITCQDTFDSLHAQLLMMNASISGHTSDL